MRASLSFFIFFLFLDGCPQVLIRFYVVLRLPDMFLLGASLRVLMRSRRCMRASLGIGCVVPGYGSQRAQGEGGV